MNKNKIAIIGGSGLEKTDLIQNVTEREMNTKWGKPSSLLKEGTLGEIPVVFLSRHGYDHSIPPTEVNNRANISALKESGCTHILTSTAVGSLKEEIKPGHLVVADQFIDFTRLRSLTFFDSFKESGVQHVSLADPFNMQMRNILIDVLEELQFTFHDKGTIITIEGPRFSTRAESHMYRILGADIVNMSIAPEAILAAEAGLPYATIAMSTDYDSWKNDEEPVTWEEVLRVMTSNSEKVTNLFAKAIPLIANL